jgi:hypothetical protein
MKIEKYIKRPIHAEPNGKFIFGILLNINPHEIQQAITFDNEEERDIVFKHWSKAIEELEASKAIYRPVYEGNDGETRILKLRYTSPEEVIRVEKVHKEHFPNSDMKLIMIYNERERTFQNVNL